jgi:hypothetical protein
MQPLAVAPDMAMVGPISEGVAQEVEVGSSGVTLMWKLERE